MTKTQLVTKLRNWNCKKKNKKIIKLKNSNCDITQKLKLWQHSHCEKKNQKLKWWQNSKTQIVTKLKNSNCDKTQIMTKLTKILLWHNNKKSNCDKIKNQIVTKPKNSNCDTSNSDSSDSSRCDSNTTYTSKDNLTPGQPMRCSRCSSSRFLRCFSRPGKARGCSTNWPSDRSFSSHSFTAPSRPNAKRKVFQL